MKRCTSVEIYTFIPIFKVTGEVKKRKEGNTISYSSFECELTDYLLLLFSCRRNSGSCTDENQRDGRRFFGGNRHHQRGKEIIMCMHPQVCVCACMHVCVCASCVLCVCVCVCVRERVREREREREDRGLTQEATASVKVVNTFELCMKGRLTGDDRL